MDEITELRLATADEYRALAASVFAAFGDSAAGRIWTVVIAFYAAVQLVNAYLWEVARLAPRDHQDRAQVMARWPILLPVLPQYDRLFDESFHARNAPRYRTSQRQAERAVSIHLAAIDRVIRHALVSNHG
jgi:hypothetical protein